MDWKVVFACFAGLALVLGSLSLSGPTRTHVDRRNDCVAFMKDRPTDEIIKACGQP